MSSPGSRKRLSDLNGTIEPEENVRKAVKRKLPVPEVEMFSDDEQKVFGINPISNLRDHPKMKRKNYIQMIEGKLWQLENIIAESASSMVFRVHERENESLYAMKIYKKGETDPEKDWMNEVKILKEIASNPHRNLVGFLEAGRTFDKLVCCTKFVITMPIYGPSLHEVMEKSQKHKSYHVPCTFPVDDIKFVGKQLIAGMRHIESLGIYHLDLKPENILFQSGMYDVEESRTASGNGDRELLVIHLRDTQIRICDFGRSEIESLSDDQKDKCPMIVQTQNYRAPEIFMGIRFTRKSDVWSLGAVLCEMYTGELLFYSTTHAENPFAQFEMMQRVVGQWPSPRMWREASSYNNPMIETRRGVYRMKRPEDTGFIRTKRLLANLRDEDVKAVPLFEFLRDVLIFDPRRRPSFINISQHRFFR